MLTQGRIINPLSTNLPDNAEPVASLGRQGELLASELHGKFWNVNKRNGLFGFNVTAVTIPVIANNLVSVFSLWNPPDSGVDAELIDFDIGQVVAATIVDAVGLYFSNDAKARAGTFTTPGTALSGRIGANPANKVIPYSAYTHSGTPVRHAILGSFGATTNANSSLPHVDCDGKIILPPGCVASVAMSTTVATASGLDLSVRWAEWPIN